MFIEVIHVTSSDDHSSCLLENPNAMGDTKLGGNTSS